MHAENHVRMVQNKSEVRWVHLDSPRLGAFGHKLAHGRQIVTAAVQRVGEHRSHIMAECLRPG